MVAVSLYDTLEFKEDAPGVVRLACDQPGLSTGPENLVCRAAELLRQRTGCGRGGRGVWGGRRGGACWCWTLPRGRSRLMRR